MNPTNFRIEPETLAAMTADKRASLKANRGFSDLEGFACQVVAQRLAKDKRRYLDYGPYWWALKNVLQRRGYVYGPDADIGLAAAYAGASDAETLVAADLFRDQYLDTCIVGERNYQLDPGEPEAWTLFDEDMEAG